MPTNAKDRLRLPSVLQSALIGVFIVVSSHAFAAIEDHAWCSYESSSFQITSDLKQDRAIQLQSFLEQFKLAAQFVIGLQDMLPAERVKIIAFRRQRDFQKLTQSNRYIGFMQPSLRQTILVLGTSKPSALRNRVAAHEYVHYMMRKTSRAFHPMWYEEGMAGYLSTLRVSRKGIVLGEVPNSMFKNLIARNMDLKQLLSENSQALWSQKKTSRFYEEAWLLVHYFKHGPHSQEQLDSFIESLNSGIESETAFERSFNTSFKSMQKALAVYAQRPRPSQHTLAYTPPPLAPTQVSNCLNPYEIRQTLGSTMQVHNPDWASELFLLQLSLYPGDLQALTHLSEIYASQGKIDEATTLAEGALSKYPGHASSQIQLANMVVSTCLGNRSTSCFEKLKSAQNLYRRALRSEPDRIDGVFGMGMTLLFLGQPDEAIKYFQVAYLKAPWAPILNFYLGETHREIGDELNARLYLSRANYWAVQPGLQRLSAHAFSLLDHAVGDK